MARPAQAKDDERVFEKVLSDKQNFVVLRHELEGLAKEHARQVSRNETKSPWPGYVARTPDHFYAYSFKLSSADGKTQRQIWQMPQVDYDDSPNKFMVFDASYEASSATLVFVYKTHGGVFGEVIDTKTMKDAARRKMPPMLLHDSDSGGGQVDLIRLGGSFAKDDLTISATNTHSEGYTFLWKGSEWKLTGFQPSFTEKNPNFIEKNLPEWFRNSLKDLKQKLGIKPPVALAKEDERVFEKTLSSTQKIVVSRHELEGVDKEHAQQASLDADKLLPPNVTSPMPDHFYIYLFRLSSADGKAQRGLWQMERVDLDDNPSNFTVFDASYEASSATLAFVYKSHGGTFGEVIDTNAVKDASHRKVPPMLLRDLEGDGVFIRSVALDGLPSKNNLTVTATNNIAEHYTFLWKGDQWVLSDFIPPTDPQYHNFTKRNIPVFIYSGTPEARDSWDLPKGAQEGGKTAPTLIQDVPIPNTDKTPKLSLFDKSIPNSRLSGEGLQVRRHRIRDCRYTCPKTGQANKNLPR